MAHIKFAWLIADMLGITSLLLWLFHDIFAGITAFLDRTKVAVLLLIGLAWAVARLYYYIVQKNQAVREKELELWHKERDKIERERK